MAVGQLGMVYPNKNQKIEFTYDADGYVRQYSAIPMTEQEQKTAIEDVLDRILR